MWGFTPVGSLCSWKSCCKAVGRAGGCLSARGWGPGHGVGPVLPATALFPSRAFIPIFSHLRGLGSPPDLRQAAGALALLFFWFMGVKQWTCSVFNGLVFLRLPGNLRKLLLKGEALKQLGGRKKQRRGRWQGAEASASPPCRNGGGVLESRGVFLQPVALQNQSCRTCVY